MPQRILFIHRHGGIGDLLLSAPIAEAIGRTSPGARVVAWVRTAYRGLLEDNPWFSNCLSIDGLPFPRQLAEIRRQQFDVVVLPWTAGRETALAWLARIPVRVGQGGRVAYSWMFTHRVDVASAHGDTSRHWTDIQLDYARALGCRTDSVRPRLFVTEEARAAARATLAKHGVSPDSRPCALHATKGAPVDLARWPVSRFVEAGRQIAAAGHQVVVIGSRAERDINDLVAREIGRHAVSIPAATVDNMSALITQMAVVVSPDSGPGHIAAALDIPVVAIFAVNASPIARWRPFGAPHRVVTTAPWACPRKCVKEKCPRFDCMEAFDATEVARAAVELAAAPTSVAVPAGSRHRTDVN